MSLFFLNKTVGGNVYLEHLLCSFSFSATFSIIQRGKISTDIITYRCFSGMTMKPKYSLNDKNNNKGRIDGKSFPLRFFSSLEVEKCSQMLSWGRNRHRRKINMRGQHNQNDSKGMEPTVITLRCFASLIEETRKVSNISVWLNSRNYVKSNKKFIWANRKISKAFRIPFHRRLWKMLVGT